MMQIADKYAPQQIESKWYDYWMEHRLFHSEPDEREPYTIVIPPPNVTGMLHMGHMLNNTLQDVLVRRARMQGKNACWVPGTDHASIATEAKVVAKLKERGIDVVVCGVPSATMTMLRRAGIVELLGEQSFYWSVERALLDHRPRPLAAFDSAEA